MCLIKIDSKEEINEFKKTIPTEGITVYKVARERKGKYYPVFSHAQFPFKSGLNKADTTEKIIAGWWNNHINYQAGFHFWINKIDAEIDKKDFKEGFYFSFKIIECKIKKSWITSVGMNKINDYLLGKTVVTNKAIFP